MQVQMIIFPSHFTLQNWKPESAVLHADSLFSGMSACNAEKLHMIPTVDGVAINLTRKETGVLEYLMLHQGRPVSQEELIEHVWDSSVDSFSNSIRVHISALRKKLRAVLGYDPIRNRIGEGYEIEGESK